MRLRFGHQLVEALGHGRQIGAVDVGVHVEGARDVEVRDVGGAVGAAELRHVRQKLRRAAGRRNRRLPQRIERIHAVLRRLHRDQILNAALRIDPKAGRDLTARRQ